VPAEGVALRLSKHVHLDPVLLSPTCLELNSIAIHGGKTNQSGDSEHTALLAPLYRSHEGGVVSVKRMMTGK
jgi:hypothetical protein